MCNSFVKYSQQSTNYVCGMKWMLEPAIKQERETIKYGDKLLLMGSCFTNNIGSKLCNWKFEALHNATGILFDPHSISRHLSFFANKKTFVSADLFQAGEIWNSWEHHSDFSDISVAESVNKINEAHSASSTFLAEADWLIITLGSSYSYHLADTNRPVANCHRMPQQSFIKNLMGIEETVACLKKSLDACLKLNPKLKLIWTVSPVRHIRDGMVENNRSKARLLEAVHLLCEQGYGSYFQAYELVIDILRDYRFFDTDLVHPNYAATEYVFEVFCKTYMDAPTLHLMDEVKQLLTAFRHKPLHPESAAHRLFKEKYLAKIKDLSGHMPDKDWAKELGYFEGLSA